MICNACAKAEACTASEWLRVQVLWMERTLWLQRYGAGRAEKGNGTQDVSGDHNHRKQEHNCLEYTDSRKCTTGEGQEDGEREMDGAEIRGRDLLPKHQKLRRRQRLEGCICPRPLPVIPYMLKCTGALLHYVNSCFLDEKLATSTSAALSDHQICFCSIRGQDKHWNWFSRLS